ncbi:MliC family protein [Allofrancisella guangzhouensis]|uniref:MliC family protein n=1 Tax=Allofrancisella guangzhouensis TaxID=594679 RepID=UPI0006894D80|nr:MliC family protein [Allofrancisella guangzhouensis]MBK2027627.1 MliC family protein [Allofrancisella guangzhouensis]MBK2044045.1 MliC family protein [Allofrancisella guangzhouensis]MBK2046508.1 MliC family protein [Allofrancisella guangzhouensis]
MKRIKSLLICLLLFVYACSECYSHGLEIEKDAQNTFVDNKKEKIIVTFYSLSDKSLSFIKLIYQGEEYTLPQVVSADGARFADGRDICIWFKGSNLYLDKNTQPSQRREFYLETSG